MPGTDIFLTDVPSTQTFDDVKKKLEEIAGQGCVTHHLEYKSKKQQQDVSFKHYQISIDTPEHVQTLLERGQISFGGIDIPIKKYQSPSERKRSAMITSVEITPFTQLSLQTLLTDLSVNPNISKLYLPTEIRPLTLHFHHNIGIDDFIQHYNNRTVADVTLTVVKKEAVSTIGMDTQDKPPSQTLHVTGFSSTTNAITLYHHFSRYNVIGVSIKRNPLKGIPQAYITLSSEDQVVAACHDQPLTMFQSQTPNLTISPFTSRVRGQRMGMNQQMMYSQPQMNPYQMGYPQAYQYGYNMPAPDPGMMMPYPDQNSFMQAQMMQQYQGYQPPMPQQMIPPNGYQNPQAMYQNMPPQQMSQMSGMMPGYSNQYMQQPMHMPIQDPNQAALLQHSTQQYQMQPTMQNPQIPQVQMQYQQQISQQQIHQMPQSQPLYQQPSQQTHPINPNFPPFDFSSLSGSEDEQKQQIGNYIYNIVETMHGQDQASKITGLIIMLSLRDLMQVVQKQDILLSKIEEGRILVKSQSGK
ncbi:hypothetical protein BLNAU_14042 [Blattamonas nauphoetae]|uniref:PABC domain-containing protein n=1 Tax=Blattamonas nauphoetae TaxID=2049346 RepID=A0ABQ9XF33_9EUKA|nr:hypothetical protein BLNAU_14042 [Blattamonas nauphoetae]